MKKLHLSFLIAIILSITFASQASARSLSINDVHIRALVMANGDLLINEMFTYNFDGEYQNVRRSVHKDRHNGVDSFEAYELLNHNAVLGFINHNDLRPLEVTREDHRYIASLPSKNESKKVIFIYFLKNAVKSYESYSDVTIPLFGTDENHDVDLHNVTIDIVFPEKLNPHQYHAFFHGQDGAVDQKTEEIVRFFTPISKKHTLTEVKVLFPSTIMTEQQKLPEPMSLEKAIAEEEKPAKAAAEMIDSIKKHANRLLVFSAFFGLAAIAMFLLPQRRLRGTARPEQLLQYDPLDLYVIDRAGVRDPYAFFAGIYSLVEKGFVTVQKTVTQIRLQQDPEAPKNTLMFTYKPSDVTPCEQDLVDWLFTRRQKPKLRVFTMNNLYGATQKEKREKRAYKHYHIVPKHNQKEKLWYDCVREEMKGKRMLSGKLYSVLTRLLMIFSMLSVLFSYFLESESGFGFFVYLIISIFLAKRAWSGERPLRVYVFFIISLLASFMVSDTNLSVSLTLFNISAAIFYGCTPRFILSREASEIRADIRQFRKTLKTDGIPTNVKDAELEKWITRAVLLKATQFSLDTNLFNKPIEEISMTAPLTSLVISGEEPTAYTINTWKWSKPPGTPFDWFWDSSHSHSDSGGGWSDSGGGDGGGGDGGGAGGD